MTLTLLLRPLLGAVIGYITNDIAIRMLFRPRKAKYIFGWKVPFTPGIIPKEKGRIASSIGDAISKNLMNSEVIEKTLLSDEMIGKIRAGIRGYVDEQRVNSETVEEYLSHYLSRDEIASLRKGVAENLSEQIHSSLAQSNLGPRIAHMVVEHALTRMREGLLGRFGADQFLSLIAAPAENLLAKNINEMIERNSAEMVNRLIGDQLEGFLSRQMRSLFEGHEEQVEQTQSTLISLYRSLVSEQLPRILEAVNISKIVENRILEMDERESERLILEVMNKELRAIVWLGALLGFIMGCLNLLF